MRTIFQTNWTQLHRQFNKTGTVIKYKREECKRKASIFAGCAILVVKNQSKSRMDLNKPAKEFSSVSRT